MGSDPHVQRLLEEILDTERTPEEVCQACPELLPRVRDGLRRLRALGAHVDAMFPPRGSDPTPPESPDAGPPQLPDYEVRSVRGLGGMGVVYRAWDRRLHRPVALKMLLAGTYAGPVERERFLREAEVTGGLEHPGIVPVYWLDTLGDGRPYYAMRLIRGDSLKEAIKQFHADAGPGATAAGGRWDCASSCAGSPTSATRSSTRIAAACSTATSSRATSSSARTARPWWLTGAGQAAGSARAGPRAGRMGPGPVRRRRIGVDPPRLGPGHAGFHEPGAGRGGPGAAGAALGCLQLGGDAVLHPHREAAVRGGLGRRDPPRAAGAIPAPPTARADDRSGLESVCLKAMALRPEDRYDSPKALAEEVERWMADEPVSAWCEPWTRTLLRWLTRHRVGVTAAGAALLVALAGTAAVLAVQTRANASLMAANAELAAANERDRARFALAQEAIRTYHTGVSEDVLLKQAEFRA